MGESSFLSQFLMITDLKTVIFIKKLNFLQEQYMQQ